MSCTVDWDAKLASVRTELEALHSEQKRIYRRSILTAALVPLTLFALAFALDRIFSGGERSAFTQVFGWAAVLLSIAIGGAFLFAASIASDERRSLAWRLATLETELDQTREALAFAWSGKSFALFLRSFGAEIRGLGDTARERGDIVRGLAMMRAARRLEWYEPDFSHIEANNKWRAQLRVLRAIEEAGLPIIMLGNTRLGGEMRSELASTGVRELTIQAQDWWQIFLRICSRASVIFFYVEEQSPMLVQEMQHVHACGLRYVLCGDDAAIRGLANVTGVGNVFLADALTLVGDDDSAAIPRLLSQLQNGGPESG